MAARALPDQGSQWPGKDQQRRKSVTGLDDPSADVDGEGYCLVLCGFCPASSGLAHQQQHFFPCGLSHEALSISWATSPPSVDGAPGAETGPNVQGQPCAATGDIAPDPTQSLERDTAPSAAEHEQDFKCSEHITILTNAGQRLSVDSEYTNLHGNHERIRKRC